MSEREAVEMAPGEESKWQWLSVFQHKIYSASHKAKKSHAQSKRNNHAAGKRTAKLTAKGYC